VFDRERQDNLYNPTAWLASEFLAWLPVNILAPTIFAVMTYFICNLRTDNLSYSLGVFIADVILVQLCFVAWALFAASLEVSGLDSAYHTLLIMWIEELCSRFIARECIVHIFHSFNW
jgi:ABC-type multidrug transport system permease subunit